MSVLSGSSFTSQGSRRSRSSLYKWNKRWSQTSAPADAKLDTRSPTPILSQRRLSGDSARQSQYISEDDGNTTPRETSQEIAMTPSQKSSVYNSSLFSDDGDDDDWLDDICSNQVRCSASWTLLTTGYKVLHW